MEFRWVAVVVLWTLLAGPIFNAGVGQQRSPRAQGPQNTKAAVTPQTQR
jgi:hypothetical protein